MRWIKSLSLIFLVTVLLLMAGVSFTLHQKLKQAEITNLTWSIDHLNLTSLQLNTLNATYQQQQHFKLTDVQIHWTDVDTWFDSSFQIKTLSIDSAQIQQIKVADQSVSKHQAPTIETPSAFSWPNTLEDWQTGPSLSARFSWLALLPKTAEIKHLSLSSVCPAGQCALIGQISASFENAPQTNQTEQVTPLQASIQGFLVNPESADNQLSFQLKAALSSENLPNLQLQLSLDKTLSLTLNNDITSDSLLLTRLQLSGMAPKPVWFKTLESWSGFSLSEAALLQLRQQALTPVKIEISNSMPLASVNLLIQQLTTQPSKAVNIQTTENSPLSSSATQPDQPSVNETNLAITPPLLAQLSTQLPLEHLSSLSTQFEMHVELPKLTPIPAIGLLQGQLTAKLELQQGVLEDYQLQTSGILSNHLITEKLNTLGFIKGIEIDKIGFELNSQRTSQKNELTSIPFELSLNSVTGSAHKSQFHLFSQGELSLEEMPNLNFHHALLTWQQPSLTIQTNPDQPVYRLSNLKADIPFTADYHNQSLTFKTNKTIIKGDLLVFDLGNIKTPIATLSQSSLQLTTLKFNLKHDDIKPLTWSLSSKQATLKTQFRSSQLKAKNLQASLNSLQLNSSDNESTSNPIQIKANYSVTTPRLEQAQLLLQFWAAKGTLSGGFNNLQFSGRISNAAELNVQHNSRWKNQKLSTNWSLDSLFFLAGNPLKKSFTFWPQQLTLASGQLALKGQFNLNAKSLKDPLSALSGTVNAYIKQISGLYQQTAFSQISTLTTLNLSNKQLNVSLPTLNITRVTHGLIAGPIQMTAQYRGSIANPLQGLLKIDTLQSGLFNGQAWLDPQTIDLSNAFKIQLHLKDAEIEELLKQHPTSDLTGQGLVDGTLPLEIDLMNEPPRFEIQQGQVSSQPSGGLLRYQPAAKSGIGKSNQSMQLVLDVLDDFHYTLLQSSVSVGADKKLILGLTLHGRNPNLEKGRAVNLNINLEEDLPSLITSMQITNQVSETIKRRVQEKIQRQAIPAK